MLRAKNASKWWQIVARFCALQRLLGTENDGFSSLNFKFIC